MKAKVRVITLVATAMVTVGTQAESITHGGTTINMDFVDIGFAGNDAQSAANRAHADGGGDGYGAVGYNYRIGKFEVPVFQWNSVIAADSNVGNAGDWSGLQPTANASWYESAKFANWLTTGDAYTGAYQFNGSGTLTNVMTRAQIQAAGGTFYVLPTEDEWHKAAYFKSNGSGYTLYATGDSIPTAGAGGENYNNIIGNPWNVGTGIAENNGTFDMNGNVAEWNESAGDGNLDDLTEWRSVRDGTYFHGESLFRSSNRISDPPDNQVLFVGLRVVAIPEPSSMILIGVAGGFVLLARKKTRR